jgi:hypothetical protein
MSNAISLSNSPNLEPWIRLWMPVATWDQHQGIDDDFLSDYGRLGGVEHALDDPLPGAGSLADYASIPFLMLLGRPGSGKSQQLRAAEQGGWLGQPTVLIEAKEIGSADPSVYLQGILPITTEVPTRLMIDGLDESLLQNPNFVAQLKAWFRRHLDGLGRPRHSLAISCRWADWPQLQIEELRALWHANEFGHLVLCPLRHCDVADTLKRRFGDNADKFWQQMNNLHLRHIACWPQGLIGLMDQFQDSGCTKLASSHADAIRDQVLRHCRLTESPDDRVRWQQSAGGCEWRRRVAGRVAASMVWSGKAQLDLADTAVGTNGEALTPLDLATTEELWEHQRVTVKLSDLDDLVRHTNLMKQMPHQKRWVFQSQVHQEWLAADWLAAQGLDPTRLKQLFGIDVDGRWTVYPALKATAAWLARFDASFRKLVLQSDPLVLLRMDSASLPEIDREEIVEALLQATHAIRVADPGIYHAHLPSLKHSKLAEQLRRWLTDENTCDPAKELAIEIAEKTDLKEIAGLLWQLYSKSVGRLQVEIAGALYRLAIEGFDEEWRAVLRGERLFDEHGTLLGAAIEIMVINSGKIPVRDVLGWMIPERHFKGIGLFQITVQRLHELLTIEDLPAVFAKLGECPMAIHDSLSKAKNLNDAAVKLAIQEFSNPDIRKALVEYWHACLRDHAHPHHDYNQNWEPAALGLEDDIKRREIILALLAHPDFEKFTERKWVLTEEFLILENDFEWCLDQTLAANPEDQWRFSLVIASLIWRMNLSGNLAEKLIAASNKSKALREMLPSPNPDENVISAISRIATEQKAKHDSKGRKWAKKKAEQDQRFQQDLERYTQECHEAHERGEIVWLDVEHILGARTSGPGSRIVSFAPISQIGPDDGWMIEAAARYLTDLPLRLKLEDSHGLYGLLALSTCPAELEHDGAVRRCIEQHWLPLFIGQNCGQGLGAAPSGFCNEYFSRLFPKAFAEGFGRLIRERYRSNGTLAELYSFTDNWLPEMTGQLQAILTEEDLHAGGFYNGLRYLALANEDAAIQVALRWLPKLPPETPRNAKAAVIGASATLVSGRLAAEVEPHLSDETLVADALRTVAHRLDWRDARIDFSKWPDQALKTLVDACWRAFPKLERHRAGRFGFHSVTDEDNAIEFRDHLSAATRARGIEILMPNAHEGDNEDEARQRLHTIDWYRHTTKQALVANSWKPISTDTFFQLASHPNARLARNNDELLEAVTECLRRWESSLAAGAWDHLWDIKSRSSRPEKRIAREMRDWLNEHLDIMAEREIELPSEDRTDVVVQTLASDPLSQKLTVVIELKKNRAGNAKERRTAMKSQLMDRYLRERAHEGWTHGLYVVAWTPIPGSSDDTPEAIAASRIVLEQQATALSTPPFKLGAMVIDARFQTKSTPTRVK